MKKNIGLAAVCLLASAVLLLLCSQCSPLYPTNVWVDANCLLTVGRVMKDGGVLYRDIYEQKGPTLYLINMLAAYIADTSFLGVYVMEVLLAAFFLFFSYKAMKLYSRTNGAAMMLPVLDSMTQVWKTFSPLSPKVESA